MNYPVLTMCLGGAIFLWGLYYKVWPATEAPTGARAETAAPAGPNFNFQGPSTNQFNIQPPAQPQRPDRDPDGIYQHGRLVGKVIAPRIIPNESKALFAEIRDAGDLDVSKNIEYRDYILRPVGTDSFVGVSNEPGGVAHNVYKGFVSEIVGRAQ